MPASPASGPPQHAAGDGSPGAAPVPSASRRCADCGANLHGAYCSDCGQRDDPIQQPLGHFIKGLFTEYLDLDGRTFRSLGMLLFRPGALTVDYVEGRRTRYLKPFRLYLTATVLFFFALSFIDPGGIARDGDNSTFNLRLPSSDTLMRAEDRVAQISGALDGVESGRAALNGIGALVAGDSTSIQRLDSLRTALLAERAMLESVPEDSLVRPGTGAVPDSVVQLMGTEEWGDPGQYEFDWLPSWLKGRALQQMEQARTRSEVLSAKRELYKAVIGQVPSAMFVLLPMFALFLKVLYARGAGVTRPTRRTPRRSRVMRRRMRRPWRRAARAAWQRLPAHVRARRRPGLRYVLRAKRTRYLSEHLVFALHVHAFAFFVFFAMLLLGQLQDSVWLHRLLLLLGWSVPVYFLLAQKRVYAQGWVKTLFKAWILTWIYGIALFFGALLALGLAAALT